MVARLRSRDWLAALATAALMLPVAGLFALADNQLCNHLQGDIVMSDLRAYPLV